jgi:hypothetical protein
MSVLLPLLLIEVVAIWIALKAKPLGTLPYRWATYLAIEFGLVGIALLASSALAVLKGSIVGLLLFLFAATLFLLSAFSLARRKRLGVIAAICGEAYLIILGLANAAKAAPTNNRNSGSILLMVVLLVINILYFRKRWSLMA